MTNTAFKRGLMTMAAESRRWMTGVEACEALDLPDNRSLARLVSEGLVGTRRLPGVRAIYRREDVEALARLSLVPAGASTETTPR